MTSAAAIAEKNVAARGGLDAWRAVKTLSISGRWALVEINARVSTAHRRARSQPLPGPPEEEGAPARPPTFRRVLWTKSGFHL
jgi:hypothetical protein